MKRLMIIGGPGSGKTTLARKLNAALGLPVHHLDSMIFYDDWNAHPESCVIKLKWWIVRLTYNFRRNHRHQILALLKDRPDRVRSDHLKTRRQVDEFLREVGGPVSGK